MENELSTVFYSNLASFRIYLFHRVDDMCSTLIVDDEIVAESDVVTGWLELGFAERPKDDFTRLDRLFIECHIRVVANILLSIARPFRLVCKSRREDERVQFLECHRHFFLELHTCDPVLARRIIYSRFYHK